MNLVGVTIHVITMLSIMQQTQILIINMISRTAILQIHFTIYFLGNFSAFIVSSPVRYTGSYNKCIFMFDII